ncbi:MAG: GAP family protein [Chloroflexota bacterium]|nr:GAP family protein [Chloroflexota bacterium]
MFDLIITFVPLGLAAIAPVMIMAVILMLSAKGGLTKSLAFILGRILCYIIWGMLFLALAGKLAGSGSEGPSTASLAIKAVLGLLLLVMAVKSFLGEDDPDAPPPKWMTALDNAGAGALFGIGFLLSVIQIRFVLLMLAGAGSIADAQLSTGQIVVALLCLVFLMIWPQVLPIILYIVMGDRAQAMLEKLNAWLARNQRMVNVVVLALFGIMLLAKSLPGLIGP